MPDPYAPNPEPRAPNPGPSGHRPPATGHVAPEEPLPFGASWRTLYFAVGATLAAVIALLALFTRAFE
jgi:hypothetical protein